MTTLKHAYIIAAAVALILFGAIVLHAYIGSAGAVEAQKQLRADIAQQIQASQKELKDALAQITKDRQEAKTPQQIVQKLPQYIPTLPKPIIIVGPGTVPSTVAGQLPDAPSAAVGRTAEGSLVIPAESVSAFFLHETECKADSLKLATCEKSLPLETKRAEAAEKAMKGGGFWARVKANGKWFVVGAATGAAAGAILKH